MMYVICSLERNNEGKLVKEFWSFAESWEVDRKLDDFTDRFPEMNFCALSEKIAIERGII